MAERELPSRPRTRILRQPQSHDGCFTCKRRKVRCDLQRPVCKRCTKAGKTCEGFPESPVDTPATQESSTSLVQLPWKSAIDNVVSGGGFEHIRLTKLGCQILYNDATRQHGPAKTIWSLMPKLGQTEHLVAASMAAFGAAVELSTSPSVEKVTVYSRYYATALGLIQRTISGPDNQSIVLIVGCLLLAASEVVVGQEVPALHHLQGMLLVLQRRQSSRFLVDGNEKADTLPSFDVTDDLDFAGAIVDIGTASYALGLHPRLRNVQPLPSVRLTEKTSLNEILIVQTLHSAYTFQSNHFEWRYVPDDLMPSGAFVKQNRVCTELFQRIQEIGQAIESGDPAGAVRARTLRAQCTACLVYVQNLFEPRETSYDRFRSSFKSVVEDAETVLAELPTQSDSYPRFSLDLGVAQPLFLTCIKCRDARIRLKAIGLLRLTGREGAFDGPRLAAISQRAMVLEHDDSSLLISDAEDQQLKSVSESDRLHYADSGIPQCGGKMAMGVQGYFGRCKDVDQMMQANTATEYKDERHWDRWNEYIPLSFGRDSPVTIIRRTPEPPNLGRVHGRK